MDDSAKESASVAASSSTDIQNYLNTFNKEIEDGGSAQTDLNKQDDCFVIAGLPGDPTKLQYFTEGDGIFAGTAFFAGPDGTLYSAATGQGDIGGGAAQIAFLAPGAGSYSDGSGMQQILLAVGDGGGLASIDAKNLSFTVPVQISSQLQGLKTNLVSEETESNQDNTAESEPSTKKVKINHEEPSIAEGVSDIPTTEDVKPQAIMLVQQQQQQGQDTVNQLVPITTSGQALIAGLGGELQMTDPHTFQLVTNLAEQAVNAKNSSVPNAASPYQTVTLVPSETNSGELSYVLFMSPTKEAVEKPNGQGIDGEDDNDENVDLSIYDFQDGDKANKDFVTVQDEEGTVRTIRVNHKKSQVVAQQQHMCNYCNYTSSKRYLLSRHMKSHSDERPHKCSVCERGFKTLASLQNHVNTHTGTRPHACKDCNSCFTTSGELVRHVRYKHTHEKPHHCTECGYASVELSKLKRHMRCHTGERPYQCPHCTYASPDTYKLKRHLRIHTGEKPYGCDICCARFTQSNSLKAHKLIHSGNKPTFQCEFCPATCGRKTDLRIHIQKLHSCDKLHKCKRCGKVFNDRYNFKLHTKSHEGEKCFKCDLCSYASVTLRHLETHMLIHTDEKPHQCDQCNLSFRQKQLLKRHINLYHNPDYVPPEPKEKNLVCSECDKAFRHKGNLIRHFAIHDPDATPAEREEAMRIGEPKEPGEVRDGEEDDEDTSDYNVVEYEDGNNKQVVVFEVIQLSENAANGEVQTLIAADSDAVKYEGDDEKQTFKITQVPFEEEKNDGVTFCELSNAACLPTSAIPKEENEDQNQTVECSRDESKEADDSSLIDLHSNSSTEGPSGDETEQTSDQYHSQESSFDPEVITAVKSKPSSTGKDTVNDDDNETGSDISRIELKDSQCMTELSGNQIKKENEDDDDESILKIPEAIET